MKDREGVSGYRTQKAGIRQGCPLSPYLFVCLMTVIFRDIHDEVGFKIAGKQVDIYPFWESFYADDTLLLGNRMGKALLRTLRALVS